MKLTTFQTAQGFMDAARSTLEENEVVNSLMLGIVQNLLEDFHRYGDEDPYLAVVEEDGQPVLGATMTPPFGVVLSAARPRYAQALELAAANLHSRGLCPPDVSGPAPLAGQFAQVWAAHTQGSFILEMAQRLYELRAVTPVEGVPGEMEVAGDSHIDLIARWMLAFQIDCFGEGDYSTARIRKGVIRSVGEGAWHLWQVDGEPVSMAIRSRPTRHGISVSGVYTPPEHRRQGYASACVAALSQKLLDQGYQFCSLFTDLANPTSNHIYMQIGYQPVVDFTKYKLTPCKN